MFTSALRLDSNVISNWKEVTSAGTSKTTFVWTVGRFRKMGAGECVSKVITAGKSQQWRLAFYPKGFTSSDYVSFFITNVGLENGCEDKIKASVTVTLKVGQVQRKTSRARSKGGIMDQLEVIKRLDKTFTPSGHTFGFNKFAEADHAFGFKNGLVWDVPDNDASKTADGKFSILVEIHQVEALHLDPPLLHPEITAAGRQRVEWLLKDVKGLTEKLGPGQFVSSDEFKANGEWYIDLYPNGYRVDEAGWLSVFLHSSLQQADRGWHLKRKFRFGLKRQNRLPPATSRELGEDPDEDAYFPPGASVTAIFNGHRRSAGKQLFVSHSLLTTGRTPPGRSEKDLSKEVRVALSREFVSGLFASAGSVAVVLDILVLDSAEGQVQQMLHVTPAFQNNLFHVCAATGRRFDVPAVFGGAKGKPCACYMCGRNVTAEFLTCGPLTRLPDFGYEVGREEVMNAVLRETQGSWIPVQQVRGWVKNTVERNAALRQLQGRVKLIKDRVRSARSGFLCEGLDHSGSDMDNDDDEDDELRRQAPTRRRKDVEDAHYAKPVCVPCFEGCRTKANAVSVHATHTAAVPGKPQAFAAGWKEKLARAEAVWGGACASTSTTSRSVSSIARGGFLCEPIEVTRQCSGRVNADNPLNEDEGCDTFCDVRFDRKGPLMSGFPKKFHCHGIGKVFCASCVRHKAKLPDHEPDPTNAAPVAVSYQVFKEREAATDRILVVSAKRTWSGPSQRRKMVPKEDEDADGGEDSEDETSIGGFLKSLFDQGKGLLEGKLKTPGAS